MSLWLIFHTLTVAFYAAFAVYVYLRRPPRPLWPVLFWVQGAALLWAAGDLAALLSPTVEAKRLALLVLYTGSLAMGPLWWLLALRFAEAHGAGSPWMRHPLADRLPLALGAVLWLAFVADPWTGWFVTPVVGARQEHHALWWGTVGVYQALAIGTCGVYASLARCRSLPDRLREQADVLLAAAFSVVAANAVDALVPWIWPVDLTIAAGGLIGLLYLYGIYRSGLFDLSPVTLSELMHQDPAGVLVTDEHLRLLYANESAGQLLPGVDLAADAPLAELLEPRLVRYQDPGTRAPSSDLRRELGAGEGGEARLYRYWAPADAGAGGEERWLWIEASALRGGRRRCLRLRDATGFARLARARRDLELRLQRARRLESLGVFAGGLAHQLRNPLAVISAQTELALARLEEDEEPGSARDALREAHEQARRGGRIIEALLRFAGRSGEPAERFDLNRAAERACAATEAELKAYGTLLRTRLAAFAIPVRIRPTEIELVVANALRNASEAGARCIEVATHQGETGAELRIRDDGPGMPERVRLRAFEPFFTTRSARGGTGLGLSVAHGIVTSHGGTLEIESSPGRGCALRIRLPLDRDDEPARPSPGRP